MNEEELWLQHIIAEQLRDTMQTILCKNTMIVSTKFGYLCCSSWWLDGSGDQLE